MNNETFAQVTSVQGGGMGMADVVPGVSGGTIAFISGIYQDLINAICSVKVNHAFAALRLVLKFWSAPNRKQAIDELKTIHWNFFIPLGVGIVASILTMAKAMPWLLKTYPFYMYSLFFGLILFSLHFPFRQMNKTFANFVVMGAFAVAMYLLLSPEIKVTGSDSSAYVFFAGSIAICAMVLPGISGSYILLLLGKYVYVLEALHARDFGVIVPFCLGIGVGILTFARILRYFLDHHLSLTMAALTGVMLGSLRKIWPGNYVAGIELDSTALTASVGLVAAGALMIVILERCARPTQNHGAV